MNSVAKEMCLKINTALCRGCQACELACSFHIKGVCNPAVSKIKITRNNETGEILCDLPASCPECSSEAEPPCVAACTIGALRVKEQIIDCLCPPRKNKARSRMRV